MARIGENLSTEPGHAVNQMQETSLHPGSTSSALLAQNRQRMTPKRRIDALLWKYGLKYARIIKKIPILNGIAQKQYTKLSFDYHAGPFMSQPRQQPAQGLSDMPWSYNRFRRQASEEGLKGKIKLFVFTCLGFFASWQEQINAALFQTIYARQAASEDKLTRMIEHSIAIMQARTESAHSQIDPSFKQTVMSGSIQSKSLSVIKEIDSLLNNQVEHYQPIYGIPGKFFTTKAKRACSDRAKIIERYFNNDVNSLRILDIGSSLGYFCFYLADRGALAEGWDFNDLNYYVSNLTKEINTISNAKFVLRSLDLDTVKNIPYDNYDCVLALSVFHHIKHEHGLAYCQDLIKSLLDKIPVLIIELANKNENKHYLIDTLPTNELEFFSRVKNYNIEKIGDFDTHVSETKRSMYAISQKHITVNNHKYVINKVLYKSFQFFNSPIQRRYYYTTNYLIKKYHLAPHVVNEENFKQIINEINILNIIGPANISHTARLVDYELGKTSVVLVLNRINGTLLPDLIDRLNIKEKDNIVKSILVILCELESVGIFHNDIRSWNIIIDNNNEPHIIDFGLASLAENENNLIAFAYLVNSLITNRPESNTYNKKTLPAFSKSILYTKYISPLNSGKIKSFKNLYDKTIRRLID